MTGANPAPVQRIIRFGLTTPAADRLVNFYEAAFGARFLGRERSDAPAFEQMMAVSGGAQRTTMALGQERIEFLQFDQSGAPYPADSSPTDIAFQHFAIVVGDMGRAMHRLERTSGWSAISTAGPQRLPPRSGGVTAYKFRDPDGHPLEFIEFPAEQIPMRWRAHVRADVFCGIDHSAISVTETQRSVAFFQGLGFRPASRGLNYGPEQERLDGIADPTVEVTAMLAPVATPHLELLCYRTNLPRGGRAVRSNDVAATRLVLDTSAIPSANMNGEALIFDPDGHRLQLLHRGTMP